MAAVAGRSRLRRYSREIFDARLRGIHIIWALLKSGLTIQNALGISASGVRKMDKLERTAPRCPHRLKPAPTA
ncbi:MAG: hypothetical protein DMG14_14745 [Acidobacteria bacterium]|nr:MAG: hypothetical protein DMG14_14745 [Acidobacteriota bacterium]